MPEASSVEGCEQPRQGNCLSAQIVLDLLPAGLVRIMATCGGQPDASYTPMEAERVPTEVKRLLAELNARLKGAADLPPITSEVVSDACPGSLGGTGRAGCDSLGLAATIAGAVVAHETQDGLLLADIEARLTNEVRGLICALDQFGRRAQLIGKEVPDSAHFCKSITSFLALLSFQLAYSFGKGLDVPVFFDDGAEYLRKLNLSLAEFVRELDLDGRRFLAVALVDQRLDQLSSSADGANKC